MRKTLTMLMIGLALIGLLSVALAETDGDFTFVISGQNATVSGYTGSETRIVIPGTMTSGGSSYAVTAIGANAFKDKTDLRAVTFPEGVTTIGVTAFSGCSALESVTLPDSLTSIGRNAFNGTAITWAKLPADMGNVGNGAFPTGTLLVVEGYNTATSNAVSAYDLCEYESDGTGVTVSRFKAVGTSATFPETIAGLPIVDIWSNAFPATLKVCADPQGDVAELLTDCGFIFYAPGDLTMGLSKRNGQVLLAQYDGSAASVTLPGSISGVESYAFSGCSTVTEITVPANVPVLGDYALAGASALQRVNLHDNITAIGHEAIPSAAGVYCDRNSATAHYLGREAYDFIDIDMPDFRLMWQPEGSNDALHLTGYLGSASEVVLPSDVKHIDWDVFRGRTDLTRVTCPEGLTTIHAGAFLMASGLSEIDLPDSVTTIEALAFYGTAIEDIHLPDGLTTIRGGEAPGDPVNTYYSDGDSYPSLPENCRPHATYHSTASHALSDAGYIFYKLDDVLFGSRYMDNLLYLVRYNGEEDVIQVPEGIEGVAYVFGLYNKMTRVEFPSTLKVIGYEAFKNCSGLTSITIPDTVQEIGYEAFAGSALRSIDLPDNVRIVGYGAFQNCTNLAAVTFRVSQGLGVTSIGDYAFHNTGLRSVAIPTTAKTIGSYAFSQSTKLATVTLPANGALTRIGSYAFSDTAIKTLTVPGTVANIDDYAFSQCGSLTKVTLNAGIRTLGDGAFSNDSQLAEINLPNGLTSIGSNAFYYCQALKEAVMPDTVTTLGSYAYQYAGLREGVTLSKKLTAIPDGTFQYSYLPGIVIPDAVTRIGQYAFESCSRLGEVTIGDSSTLKTIGSGAFNNSGLTFIKLPSSMTTLSQCFDGCSKAVVVLPDSIKYIQGIAFRDVRGVFGSHENDILKSLDRFGFEDEMSFIYTYIGDDGLEDYDTLRIVDYIGDKTEDDLLDEVKVIKSNAFANASTLRRLHVSSGTGLTTVEENGLTGVTPVCAIDCPDRVLKLLGRFAFEDAANFIFNFTDSGALRLVGCIDYVSPITVPARPVVIGSGAFSDYDGLVNLPDSGIDSIESNAFGDCTQINCTKGSATWQLLKQCGYALPVEGTPGLYAVEKDGKLNKAFYRGSARIVDLPDNIASTFMGYTEMREEYVDYYDDDGVFMYTDTGYVPYDHPAGFPASTIYRTKFDALTASTLSDADTPITVAGLEDFGFQKNQHPMVFESAGTSIVTVHYSQSGSDDTWFMVRYYGSKKDVTLPDEIQYMDVHRLHDLDSLTLGSDFYCVSDRGDCEFDYPGENFHNSFVKPKLILKDRTAAGKFANHMAGYMMNTGISDNLMVFYIEGYPELELSLKRDDYGSSGVVALKKYNGSAATYELTEDTPFDYALPEAFGNTKYYMKGYPDLTVNYQTYNDYDETTRYGLVVTGYTGSAKTITLGSDMFAKDIQWTLPSDVKLMMDPADLPPRLVNYPDFYLLSDPDFEYHLVDPETGVRLKKYHGTKTEIAIPAGTKYVESDALPATVTKVHVDELARDYMYRIDTSFMRRSGLKVFAEQDSPFVKAATAAQDIDISGIEFFETDYPDIAYMIDWGNIGLGNYHGSGNRVVLPGYYNSFAYSVEPNASSNPYSGHTVYTVPGSATARLLDNYGIPWVPVDVKTATLPAALTTIDEEAFAGSSFQEVIIPDKCTAIGARAFADCRSLCIIHIPARVKRIDETAFDGCRNMTFCVKAGSTAETFARNHNYYIVYE